MKYSNCILILPLEGAASAAMWCNPKKRLKILGNFRHVLFEKFFKICSRNPPSPILKENLDEV